MQKSQKYNESEFENDRYEKEQRFHKISMTLFHRDNWFSMILMLFLINENISRCH